MVLRREFRRLCGSPGLLAGFVVPLALLSAAVAAASYFCYALILKPLPYPHGERIVIVGHQTSSGPGRSSTGREFRAWSEHSRQLDATATAAPLPLLRWVTAEGRVEALQGVTVPPGFFDVFAVTPVMGRLPAFTPDDAGVVISWRMWQMRLGGRPDVLGMTLNLAGKPGTVTGVMPQHFDAPRIVYPAWDPPDIWMAHAGVPESDARRTTVLARLAPAATVASAQAELQTIADGLPAHRTGDRPQVTLRRAQDAAPQRTLQILRATAAGAAVLLLLGLVNAVPIYLTRMLGRRREVSTLSALGATRSAIAGMFVAESALLAAGVGAAAALLSGPLLTAIVSLAPQKLARLSEVGIGPGVIGGAAIVGIAAALVACGLAAGAAFRPLTVSLAHLRDAGAAQRPGRLRSLLLCSQIALSVALVAGAVLLARTALHLQTVDRGFEPAGLTKVGFWLPPGRGAADAMRLLEGVSTGPMDGNAAIATSVPGTSPFNAIVVGGGGEEVTFGNDAVSSSYFETVGLQLVAGRAHRDDAASEVVIDTNVARWLGQRPDELPGQTVMLFGKPRVVAGVSRSVRAASLEDGRPMVYSSYLSESFPAGFLLVRSADGAAALRAIRQHSASEVPGVMFFGQENVWERLTRDYERQWFLLTAGTLAAGVALTMTVVGMIGFVMYLFRGRRRELAIRAALGATPRQIRWLSVRSLCLCVVCGAVLGIPLAAASESLLRSVLMGPASAGLPDAVGIAVLLICLAFLAGLASVRRSDVADLTAQLHQHE